VDWAAPSASAYGMVLNRPGAATAEARYRAAFAGLERDLGGELAGIKHVFTHNPWGEYGHPDHVQVSSVVRSLARELRFGVSYSAYVAPRSLRFAAEFLPRLRCERVLATDTALAERIQAHYVAHGCWTWHPDYRPPRDEAFLVEADSPPSEAEHVPLHCLMTT
jgi:hypothetical protein